MRITWKQLVLLVLAGLVMMFLTACADKVFGQELVSPDDLEIVQVEIDAWMFVPRDLGWANASDVLGIFNHAEETLIVIDAETGEVAAYGNDAQYLIGAVLFDEETAIGYTHNGRVVSYPLDNPFDVTPINNLHVESVWVRAGQAYVDVWQKSDYTDSNRTERWTPNQQAPWRMFEYFEGREFISLLPTASYACFFREDGFPECGQRRIGYRSVRWMDEPVAGDGYWMLAEGDYVYLHHDPDNWFRVPAGTNWFLMLDEASVLTANGEGFFLNDEQVWEGQIVNIDVQVWETAIAVNHDRTKVAFYDESGQVWVIDLYPEQ